MADDHAQKGAAPSSLDEPTSAAGTKVADGARIATLLLSDLVGSSALVERTGDAASAALFEKHDRIARDLLERHGGLEIDKTDGFLMLFDRPWQAVLYALDYHRALAELSSAQDVELASRVGIHLGEVFLRRNPPEDVARGAKPLEVEGLAKPTAARLMSVAGGRQTLLTQAAFDLARRSAVGRAGRAESLRWLAHGSYLFKGVEEPVEVFEVGVEGIAPLAPPESSEKVTRGDDEDTILGWRPAPGLEIPYRPDWVVKEKLGEGGFGEVWLGEQKKTGEERVYKFCYEAERLRSLQREITVFRLLKEELGLREDIVRVLGWNLDEAPYFIEFVHVEGGSLVDWAAAQGGLAEVPLAERLELAAQVATAMAAAHSVGVLHKDVKPANVLIESDAEGHPRAVLTDFGIGLVTDHERLAAKGITMLGLTEAEATTGGSSATGTQLYMAPELMAGEPSTIQADIFAFGVMLYQLVVGDLNRPLAQGWKRHVENELLREDIAALIDGTPARRPGSAAPVAERLRNLEERRAARAAEEQAAHAAERARRRRKVLGTVAAVSTVFLVVVSILAVQAFRARADAERRRAQAERLIDFMLNDLHEGLDRTGRLDLLEDVARSSQTHFESLGKRDESLEALYQRGMTLQNIGQVLLDQGDADAARVSQEAAIALFEEGAERQPDLEGWRRGLSKGRLGLGNALREQGDTEAALASYLAALEAANELSAADPEDRELRFAVAQSHYQIAFLQHRIGNLDACFEEAAAALALLEPMTAAADAEWRHQLLLLDTHKLLAQAHRFHGAFDDALDKATRVREIARRLQTEDPGNAYWSRRLAWSHSEIGLLLALLGNPEVGLESAREASAAYRALIITDPTRVRWREMLAYSLQLNGYILAALDRPAEALDFYNQANAILEEVVSSDPTRVSWLRQLADSHQIIGQIHLSQGRTAAAIESLSAATELHLAVVAITGDDPAPRNEVAWNRVLLGDVYAERQEMARAREQWTLAVEGIAPITASSDESLFLDTHAQALLRLGRLEEGRPLVERLVARDWDGLGFRELVQRSGLDVEIP